MFALFLVELRSGDSILCVSLSCSELSCFHNHILVPGPSHVGVRDPSVSLDNILGVHNSSRTSTLTRCFVRARFASGTASGVLFGAATRPGLSLAPRPGPVCLWCRVWRRFRCSVRWRDWAWFASGTTTGVLFGAATGPCWHLAPGLGPVRVWCCVWRRVRCSVRCRVRARTDKIIVCCSPFVVE